MKIINAKFKNFRLLKDLELDFSTDQTKKLTVIRAANETGKTTTLNALIWGLYGSSFLPSKRYIITPSDLIQSGVSTEIEVEISFTTDVFLTRKSEETVSKKYILRRNCREEIIQGVPTRTREIKVLYEYAPEGTKIIDDDSASKIIEDALPASLKDVYFTDGDSALSFIDANTNSAEKRRRVENAIKSLLGLDYVEKSQKVLARVYKLFETEVDLKDYAKIVKGLNDRLEFNEGEIVECEDDRNVLSENYETEIQFQRETNQKIEAILANGNRDELVRQKNEFLKQTKRSEEIDLSNLNDLAKHTYSFECSCRLIKTRAQSVQKMLNEAKHEKQIPKLDIPVLTQLLKKDICFCGTVLDVSKRNSILYIIENSKESDAVTDVATTLLHQIGDTDFEIESDEWLRKYRTKSQEQSANEANLRSNQSQLINIESKIDAIQDTDLQTLRIQREESFKRSSKYDRDIGSLNSRIDDARSKLKEINNQKKVNEEKLGRGNKSANYINLTKDIISIYRNLYEKLKNDELIKVSVEMNRIFLKMIGSSPDLNDKTSLTKAVLNANYEIEVYGANNHKLNPDQDLNGASRRAITLSFILALTKVSEVMAPNFIDTPLGMMSGYVKQSAMKQLLDEGSQVILFLTHDEIKGVEEIIDQYAGNVLTLTNQAHYPLMLKNKANTTDLRIVRCNCNHRTSCDICERKFI